MPDRKGSPSRVRNPSGGNAEQFRRQNTPIPTNDIWIGALVLQHNLVLHARDRHFDHVPQIVRA